MAPAKKMKTYGRANTSSVNNSVDAFNILFAKNVAKRVIGKNRKKYIVKELPSRLRCESVLMNDSFHISMEDTFDKLVKQNKKSQKNSSFKNTVNKSQSVNKSKFQNSISQEDTFYSPIMTRQRKKVFNITDSLQITETLDSFEKTHLRRLKEPSDEKIDVSLELEKITNNPPNTSLSYIQIPNALDSSKLGESMNCFTKNLQQNLFTNCSTPVVSSQKKMVINHTISPVKLNSLMQESLPSDENKFPKTKGSMSCIKDKSYRKSLDKSNIEFKMPNISLKNLTDKSIPNYSDLSSCKFVESGVNKSINITPNKRESFITLRRRKVIKSNKYRKNKNVNNSSRGILTASLESFNTFEKQNLSNTSSQKLYSLKDFELFESLISPTNFITNTTSTEVSSSHIDKCSKENLNFETSNNSDKSAMKISNQCTLEPKIDKELIVKISKLQFDSLNPSITSLESQFENFYTTNISLELNKSENISETETVNNEKYLPNSLDNFEQFYTSNFTCSEYNLTSDEETNYITSRRKSSQNKEKVKCTENDLIINITNSKNQETLNDESLNENIILQDLHNSTTESCELNKLTHCADANDNYSLKSNELYDQKALRICLTNNSFSDVTNTSPISNDNIENIVSSNNSQINSSSCELPTTEKSDINQYQVDQTVADVNITEHFEMFYKNHYDEYDVPLPTSVVTLPSEKNNSDIIESSYTDNSFPKNIKKKIKIKSKLTTLEDKSVELKKNLNLSLNNDIKIVNGPQFTISSNSDVLNCSIIGTDEVNKDGFKIPSITSKPIHLKAGKSWKRSFSKYKRCSSLGYDSEECCSPYLAKFCPKGKSRRPLSKGFSRRLSVKLVPLLPLHELQLDNENGLLQEFALNASYVPDPIIEASLEDSLKCLSLNQRNSHNKTRLDQIPITAKDIVLRRCGQTEPLEFSKCFPDSILQNCQKIGEGVYGEVFLLRNPNGGTSVIKIVPVEGDQIVNGERQKKFEEVLSEIIITMELSNLRNNQRNGIAAFTEVQKIQCVQGRYPEKFIDLWDLYYETRGTENDCPDIFGDDQLYIVFQMAYGGRDLESYIFNNSMQAYSMFQQVSIALAVAEEELHFEHRDLHWGNVLLSTVESNKITSFKWDNQNYDIPTMGVEVAIIDYTLSRIEHDGVAIFNDLSLDPDLFTAEGDYQFEVYRLMQAKNRDNWKDFEPFTNILWLHYILDKAILALRYKNIKTKRHKDYLQKLKMLKEDVLSYRSVKEFVSANLLQI